MPQHDSDTKLPAGAPREQIFDAEEAGDEVAGSMRSVVIFIMGELEVGKAVSLDLAVWRMRQELQRANSPVMSPKQASTPLRLYLET